MSIRSLSHIPIDILKATFQWIHPQSIDACLLRQTCSSIKWVLVNQMGWAPKLNSNVQFNHDLIQIHQRLPELVGESRDLLKMTCLRQGQSLNFKFLHKDSLVLLNHVTTTVKHGHLDCLTYLLSNWNVELAKDDWLSLYIVATTHGHLSIVKWYFSQLTEYIPIANESTSLPGMQRTLAWMVEPKAYVNHGLVLASEYGHLDLVEYYKSLGADPTTNDNQAIQKASGNGHLGVVKYLHSNGVDVNANRSQSFIATCRGGHLQVAQFLYSCGAEVDTCDDLAFRLASRRGRLETLQFLYSLGRGRKGKVLRLSLMDVCSSGDLNVLKYLVSIGADIHVRNNLAFQTACLYGHIEVVKYLYSLGADYQYDNWLAFIKAIEGGELEVVQFFYSLGADIHALNNRAIRLASKFGHLNIVHHLHSLGADIHALNDDAVQLASQNGHLDVVVFLHSLGANVRAGNGHAFKQAAYNSHLHVVKFLHSVSDSTQADKDYALDSAVWHCDKEMVAFLISIGADVHSLNRDFSGNPDIVGLLQSL
jgi:ankyrin repeat protein